MFELLKLGRFVQQHSFFRWVSWKSRFQSRSMWWLTSSSRALDWGSTCWMHGPWSSTCNSFFLWLSVFLIFLRLEDFWFLSGRDFLMLWLSLIFAWEFFHDMFFDRDGLLEKREPED